VESLYFLLIGRLLSGFFVGSKKQPAAFDTETRKAAYRYYIGFPEKLQGFFLHGP
jgi:hypothetical protein